MADNYILEMENVDKIYGSGDSEVKALNHVSFSVHKGEFIAIIGESGSGKSTLLNIVGMLDRPTNGKIVIDGIEQREMTLDQQAVFRRENIGFIFQSFNLIQELTVEENIIFPISLGHNKPDRKKIDSIINKLGLEKRKQHFPSQLSGGQQQRVAIGRALATEPKLILADEPTGNLDSKNSQDVMDMLTKASRQYQQTILIITHNKNLTVNVDRVFQVCDGVLTDLGGSADETLS